MQLTLSQAAAALRIEPTLLRTWIRAGLLPASGGGRQGIPNSIDETGLLIALLVSELRSQGSAAAVVEHASRLVRELGFIGIIRSVDRGSRMLVAKRDRASLVALNQRGLAAAIVAGLGGAAVLDLHPIVEKVKKTQAAAARGVFREKQPA